ncbi:tRNA(Met) cytidine acetyltransferase TmcA [Nymphon striatum]|nr:tRNA(Met) cytidine acetyltransferase TmcA [Nymphon striatum]
MAVGYATLYGDMAGGFAPIKDVFKTVVYDLARYRNSIGDGDSDNPKYKEIIPERVITRPPSAELAPDQVDEDSLPPYDVLDAVLRMFIEEYQSVEDIVAQGFDLETVERVAKMVLLNEYKRRQAPPGLLAGESIEALPVFKPKKTLATKDQIKAVEAIVHVVKGHRRRPLLISSDRGRGKSAALGIAAAQLLRSGCQHIIVCAPSKKTAEMVFKHAELEANNPDIHERVHFYAPDELLNRKPKTDLLLIDEAAAIPLKLLNQLLKHYSRVVFSTTEHGYEGCGRGFSIRFRQTLDNKTPGWKNCQLHTPIRWDEDDPLEQFIFNALLLDVEPNSLGKMWNKDISVKPEIKLSDCEVIRLDKNDLLQNEQQLKSLFGLLVVAHYQTRPSDLQALLDDDSFSIYVTQYKESIIATALVAREGGLDESMAQQIYEGSRRPKGNLVAQVLAASSGIKNAPCLLGDRVVRIAVHPDLHRQGLGDDLLQTIIKESTADYVSTSFGATPELLKFWKQASFEVVNIGVKRDASSGVHSVTMLCAKAEDAKTVNDGQALVAEAKHHFTQYFPHLLADTLQNLDPELVFDLMNTDSSINMEEADIRAVLAFSDHQRAYESSVLAIWKLVCKQLTKTTLLKNELKEEERTILIRKVIQKHSWQKAVQMSQSDTYKLSGKKQALALLRQATSNLNY